jgi:hypothetical protein
MTRSALALLVIGLSALAITTAPLTTASAEEPATKPRFISRGEYVEDTSTSLLWQRDGNASGKLNFYQAAEYAKKLKLGGMSGWRVPTRDELAAIFPATDKPFVDTQYTTEPCCDGPHQTGTYSYWTSELDAGVDDYAYIYQWYAEGAPNNGYASKNYVYVRAVHDPVKKRAAATPPTTAPARQQR